MSYNITDHIHGKVREDGSTTKYIIVTGRPSSGKTTIIKRLETDGYAVINEAAAQIIVEEKAAGIEKPWDQPDFETKVVVLQKQWMEAVASKTNRSIVTDRSAIDAMSYCLRLNHKLSKEIIASVQEHVDSGVFSKYVLWVDHLGKLENNEIRHENLKEAEEIEKCLRRDYGALGFVLISIPKATIQERVIKVKKIIEKLFSKAQQ